jgi:molybdopterin-guanine dinucleotide biosynthesis protein A
MHSDLSVVILAGGNSSRMGRDKSFVRVGGRAVIERIIAQVSGFGAETLVITNNPEDYAYLGLPLYGDVLPGKGALGGLYTARTRAACPYALVVACDMPFVNLGLLEHLVSLAREHDAVVPRLNGEAEPFRAVYAQSCQEPMRRALEAGKMRVISFFPEVRVRYVETPEVEQYDPDHLTFFNVNTPEELQKAEELARRFDGPASPA